MSNELIERYTKLKNNADDITLKRAAAVARLEDAESKLAESVAEVTALGFGTVAELQAAIATNESEMQILLDRAEEKLKKGGYS